MTEQELILRVQRGDTAAFSVLVDQNKNLVYSVVLRMVKSQEDAEEVAQDAFLKAFQQIKHFKGKAKFSTWLYKIAYFSAVSHLRKNHLLTTELDMLSIADQDDVLDQIESEEIKIYLEEALNYLRPIDRNLIAMYYLQEMSIKEIQAVTLFTASNIKVKLMRIRKELNGILSALMKNEIEHFVKR